VDFGFSEQQLAFRDAVRDLLQDACPPAAVRRAWEGDGPVYDAKLWARLAEMGVIGMLGPVEAGGLGLDEVDLVLVLEELGRSACPGPIMEHVAVAVPALAPGDLLDRAVRGDAVVGFAGGRDRVGWPASCDAVVLVVDGQLRIVEAGDVTSMTALDCVDRSRRDASIECRAGRPVDADPGLALDRAALGAAAQLCGLGSRLVTMTVEYARARHQFGVPIGSFQAVKHHLANAWLQLEHARPAVYRAAYSVATHAPARSRDVSMAKVMAGNAATLAGRVALQCHGAIGYTWEHDLHLWLKRVWVLDLAFGDRPSHRSRVADAVIGVPSR
jgi:alkylation response protein AidB-like acyl-CoA dehydrogenase